MRPHPWIVIPLSLRLMLTGRTVSPHERVGQTLTLSDGRRYRVFREVWMADNPPREDGGVFRVWFYSRMSVPDTIRLSRTTRLLFFGMPGFRGKLWLVNDETGEFGGIYQFSTVEQAAAYRDSFAMALSKRRAVPGHFAMEVYAKHGEASLLQAQAEPLTPPRGLRRSLTPRPD